MAWLALQHLAAARLANEFPIAHLNFAPHRHDGRAYRPTGPTLLSGAQIAGAVGEALGRKVRHIDIPAWMFMRAVRVNAKRLGAERIGEPLGADDQRDHEAPDRRGDPRL